MPQLISVPNEGDIEFPDDMSDADIASEIERIFPSVRGSTQEPQTVGLLQDSEEIPYPQFSPSGVKQEFSSSVPDSGFFPSAQGALTGAISRQVAAPLLRGASNIKSLEQQEAELDEKISRGQQGVRNIEQTIASRGFSDAQDDRILSSAQQSINRLISQRAQLNRQASLGPLAQKQAQRRKESGITQGTELLNIADQSLPAAGADPRSENTSAQVGRGVGEFLSMLPVLFTGVAGLPLATAQMAASTYSGKYQQVLSETGDLEKADEEASTETVKVVPHLAAYVVGGKLAASLTSKMLPASAGPVTKGVAGTVSATGANVAVGSTIRALEGENWKPTIENLTMDTLFGIVHGLGEYRTAGTKARQRAAEELQRRNEFTEEQAQETKSTVEEQLVAESTLRKEGDVTIDPNTGKISTPQGDAIIDPATGVRPETATDRKAEEVLTRPDVDRPFEELMGPEGGKSKTVSRLPDRPEPTQGETETIASESNESLNARTKVGADRDAALKQRAQAATKLNLELKAGDKITLEDGTEYTVVFDAGSRGDVTVRSSDGRELFFPDGFSAELNGGGGGVAKITKKSGPEKNVSRLPVRENALSAEEAAAVEAAPALTPEQAKIPASEPEPVRPPVEGAPAAETSAPRVEATPTEPASRPEQPGGEFPTGIRNAITDADRARYGLPPATQAQKVSEQAMLDAAEAVLAKDSGAAARLVTEVNQDPRPLNYTENALLLHRKVEIDRNFNSAVAEMNAAATPEARQEAAAKVQAIAQERVDVLNATRATSNPQGLGLASRKLLVNEDFSRATMVAKKMAENKGEPLSEKDLATVLEQAKVIEETQKKIDAMEDKAETKEATELLKTAFEQVKADKKAGKKKDRFESALDRAINALSTPRSQVNIDIGIQVGKAALRNALEAVRAVYRKGKSVLDAVNAGIDNLRGKVESFDENAAREYFNSVFVSANKDTLAGAVGRAKANAVTGEGMTKDIVGQIALGHIREGVHGERDVMAATFKTLKEIFPGTSAPLTERDIRRALVDYGKAKFPSKKADLAELRELKTVVRLQESIDRLKVDMEALRTGPQRDKATQAIRDKQAELNELLKKRQGPPSPGRLATMDEARQTALKNRIADIDRELQTGERRPDSEPSKPSTKTEALMAERDAMLEKLREVRRDAQPDISPEQKALDQALVQRERWEQVLRGEVDTTTREGREAMTQFEEDVRSETAAMRKLVADMKRVSRRGDPEAAANLAKIKAAERATELYQQAAKTGVAVARSGKRLGPETKAVSEALARRDEALKQLREAQKASGYADAVKLESEKNAIRNRTEELRRRVRENDYSKPSKREPLMDDEKAALMLENEKAKEEYFVGLIEDRMKHSTGIEKWLGGEQHTGRIGETLSLARSLMLGYELSYFARQGKLKGVGHPIIWAKSLVSGIKSTLDPKNSVKERESIRNDKAYRYAQQGKLFIAEEGTALTKAEELYLGRYMKMLSKLPNWTVIGPAARANKAFERGNITIINRLRFDTFKALTDSLGGAAGLSKEELRAIANDINVATGRGTLGGGKLELAGPFLSTYFLAARFRISRLQFLVGQPLVHGALASKRVRNLIVKEYIRTALGLGVYYGMWSVLLGTAVTSAGDLIKKIVDEFDDYGTTQTDFSKFVTGNTRLDPLASEQQAIVAASRVFTGKKKLASGKVVDIKRREEDEELPFGSETVRGVAGKYFQSALHPWLNTAISGLAGEDPVGKYFQWSDAPAAMMVPITGREMVKVLQERYGVTQKVALELAAFLGENVTTYDEREPKKKRKP